MSKKPKGWCRENGVAHAWVTGPTFPMSPPTHTRVCSNCGQMQRLIPQYWEDYPSADEPEKRGDYVHG